MDFTPTGGPRPTEGLGGATENAVTEDGGPAVTGPAGGDGGASNTADYCALDSQHTMCLHTGPSDACTGKTILRAMTEAGKATILAKHNELRKRFPREKLCRVAKGEESGQ